MRKLFTYLILLATCFSASAQTGVEVMASIDRDSILIGEQLGLSLTVSGPEDQLGNVRWPNFGDTITKHIEIVQSDSVPDTLKTNSVFVLNYNYLITSFDSGRFEIPPIRIDWENTFDHTEKLWLYSSTVMVDTTMAIKEIKDIYEVDRTFGEWMQDNWIWLSITAAVLLIGFIAWRMLRKKEEPEPEMEKVTRVLALHEAALRDLELLETKQLWQKGEYKLYYSQMTDILRGYVEKRYNITAFEQTTEQLTENLRFSKMEESARMQLKHILTIADLVKFAKEKPLDSENKRNMEESMNFINRTRELHTPAIPPIPE